MMLRTPKLSGRRQKLKLNARPRQTPRQQQTRKAKPKELQKRLLNVLDNWPRILMRIAARKTRLLEESAYVEPSKIRT